MLSSLRIIVVANGRKKLGAILQGIVALVWIFVTGVVIIDVSKDLLKVFFFCIGTITGSYIGSLLEEKVALGENLLICSINKNHLKDITKILKENNIMFHYNKDKKNYIIYIYLKRSKVNNICSLLKKIDKDIFIISENAKKIV